MWTNEEMATKMNKIHNMDCLEFMKQVPDNYFDLVLTDPPYGINMAKSTNIVSKADINGKDKKGFSSKKLHGTKEWDSKRPSIYYFNEITRISKNQIIFGGNYFADMLPASRCWIFWDKKDDDRQGQNFADGELAWTSFDKNVKRYLFGWIGLSYINNRGSDIKQHPTQKPLELFKTIIEDFSDTKHKIFDPFIGSGTTAVACKSSNIEFCGCELEPDYCEIANKRLSKVQTSMFAFMDEVTA